ncbi:MAG TPA: hypothetical protein DEO84_03145 [candidate division Zixibacteria bacterium]|nr:hypothetical protein [candidate division Zixibacteria bacterium]HBZ00297.1 hypothetical protein [candidate division Zixibacteria bacterium]
MIGLSNLAANIMAAAIVSLSPEVPVSYQIDAKLDRSTNIISGVENIEFLNPTPDTLDRICFHLYPNAFRDTSTVFCRENSQIKADVASGNISELKISDLTIDSLRIDSSAITESGTLYYVRLPAKLAPLESIYISLRFDLKIPKARERFGYNELGNYLLSYWHPVLAGYQKGRLVDFEYHANSEFFSNFGNYDVRLDIPSSFRMGTTGELTEVSKDSSRTIWEAHADTVLDFAIACGSAFEVSESDTLGINLRYLLEKRHEKYRPATDMMTKLSLSYNSGRFYKYPYKTFTLVDFESGAEGMELPGMVVIRYPDTRMFSNGRSMLELTIAHEITHEWFYATIASNEAEEPWLDEGVTSYVTERLLDSGGDTLGQFDVLGYKFKFNVFERLAALISKGEYPINLKSWDYPDDAAYGINVYNRSTLVLKSLEDLLGRSSMDSALGAYVRQYRFGHPDLSDFENAISSTTGVNLNRFYAQYITGTSRVDYGIRSLSYKSITTTDSLNKYEITLKIARELDGILPQKISLTLENGNRIDTTWEDTTSRVATLKFYTVSRPQFAVLAGYALDENIANNSMYAGSFGSRLISFEWDSVFMVEFFLSLIL